MATTREIETKVELASAKLANGDNLNFDSMAKQLLTFQEMTEDGIITSFGIPDFNDLTDAKELGELGIEIVADMQGTPVNPDFADMGYLRIVSIDGEEVDGNDIAEYYDGIIEAISNATTAEKAAFGVALSNAMRGYDGATADLIRDGPDDV